MKRNSPLAMQVLTDIKTCQKIWQTFVIPKTIWDLWTIREILIDVYKYPLYFIVVRRDKKIVGALPLWFNRRQNNYEWISEGWPEGNYPFTNSADVLKEMLNAVPGKLVLEAIDPPHAKLFGDLVVGDADHFGIDLTTVGGTWEGFVQSLPRKKRQTVRWDIRKILSRKPVMRYNHYQDLQQFYKLSIFRMRQKVAKYADEELSTYEGNSLDRKFIDLLWQRRGKDYHARIIAVLIDGRVVSCDFNLIFDKIYYSLHGAANVTAYSGMGSFANMLDIQDAVDLGCTYVDFCMEDHHWKRAWFAADSMCKYVQSSSHL